MSGEPMRWCAYGQHRVYAFDFRDERRAICRECHAARERTYRLDNREHVRSRELKRRGRYLVHSAERRARRQGVPFDLDQHVEEINDRVLRGYCELTGLPFNAGDAAREWDSPTLDRIRAERGYVLSNVRVVCWGINAALGNWGADAMLQIVEAYKRKLLP